MRKSRYRKYNKRWYWIVILVLILPGFILWGSETIIYYLKAKDCAGIVFGKKISFEEFKRALIAVHHQLILQKGDKFLKQQSDLDLTPQAWDRIILLKEAKRRKIKVTDDEVKDFIEKIPLFRANNKFNFDLYRNIIHYILGTDMRLFEEEMRENLMISKFYEEITKDVKLTEEEVLLAFRQENEMIAVEYISISPKELEKEIVVDEQKLYQYYQDNRQAFKKPSAFDLQYITEDNPEKIKRIYNALRRTKDFEGFLKKNGYKIEETGFFSLEEPIPGIDWSLSFSYLIEKLEVGQIIGPLKIKNKYYLIRLKQKRYPYIPVFTEIKDKLKEKWVKTESKKIAKETLDKVLSEIKNMQDNNLLIDFQALAKKYNLQYGTTELFKRSSYIPGLGASDKFFKVFNELKENSLGKEIVETEQALFIVRLKSLKPIDGEAYKKQKEEFTKNLTSKIKDIRFWEFLEQLREKAKINIRL
jgi:peptidyl-prolyl cis-trans isomerase D